MSKDNDLLKQDEFGRWNGIVLINKPRGRTSHDIVNDLRKKYQTRKVGHAGTLDPFAEGLLVMFVGKATKLSDQFLGLDKVYEAEVIFGIETDSGDPEGRIVRIKNEELRIKRNELSIKKTQIEKVLQEFVPGYEQNVPVFSSVKVNGNKLRKLARRYDRFEIVDLENMNKAKVVRFFNEKNDLQLEIPLPHKTIKLYEMEICELNIMEGTDLVEIMQSYQEDFTPEKRSNIANLTFQTAKIRVSCSSGTYVRQLVMDIGKRLGTSAMLINLKRTKIGEFNLAMDS